jgi:hypothetical protein
VGAGKRGSGLALSPSLHAEIALYETSTSAKVTVDCKSPLRTTAPRRYENT